MTAKTGTLTPVVGGFKFPRDNSYHYDGSDLRQKGAVVRSLLSSVETSIYRLREWRLRRGATTMQARPTQTTDQDEQDNNNNNNNNNNNLALGGGWYYSTIRGTMVLVGGTSAPSRGLSENSTTAGLVVPSASTTVPPTSTVADPGVVVA